MKNQFNLEWYQSELNKDKIALDKQKTEFINEIKKLKKDDIVTKKDKKISIWRRILRVLAS